MSSTGIAIDPAKPRLGVRFAGALVGAVVVIGLAVARRAGATDEVVLAAVVAGGSPSRPCSRDAAAERAVVGVDARGGAGRRDHGRCARGRAARAVRRVRLHGRAPQGRLPRELRWLIAVGAVVAIGAAVVATNHDTRTSAVIVESILLGFGAVFAYVRVPAGRRGEPQPVAVVGWGVIVAGAARARRSACHALLDWPRSRAEIAIGATLFMPLSIAVSSVETLALRIDRLLVHTIEAGGIVLMVGAVYLVVVLGFGDAPDRPSAACSGSRWSPRRSPRCATRRRRTGSRTRQPARLRRAAGTRRADPDVRRAHVARDPARRTAAATRGVVKKSMQLAATEVWTGTDGVLELAASVPYREAPRIRLIDDEVT